LGSGFWLRGARRSWLLDSGCMAQGRFGFLAAQQGKVMLGLAVWCEVGSGCRGAHSLYIRVRWCLSWMFLLHATTCFDPPPPAVNDYSALSIKKPEQPETRFDSPALFGSPALFSSPALFDPPSVILGFAYPSITTSVTNSMTSSGHGQISLDVFICPGTAPVSNTRPRSPAKRAREDSDPKSDFDKRELDENQIDYQRTEHVTATQTIGDLNDDSEYCFPQLPIPLSPEHAVLRSDFEIIMMAAMERLYSRIAVDIKKSAYDTCIAFQKTTDQLHNQIALLSARVTQLQQQTLTSRTSVQHVPQIPGAATGPAKKEPKKKNEKQTASQVMADNTRTSNNLTYTAVAANKPAIPPAMEPPVGTSSWTTMKTVSQKKKSATPKLIPTIYLQAERDVTCHFMKESPPEMGMDADRTHSIRQAEADVALRRVNSALVDNRDINIPPFIRACVTIRGAIISTTSNTQNNIIYEDYSAIIADALSYYGKCERVEIGQRFSQFLLHGVPTHLSIPDIS